jgi:hypothetical protein
MLIINVRATEGIQDNQENLATLGRLDVFGPRSQELVCMALE